MAAFESFSNSDLINELRRRVRCSEKKDKTMAVLVGAPGSGKGTRRRHPALPGDVLPSLLVARDTYQTPIL
jgi:16S rRNA C967 or C1407 C5-methylase (RsmB/RsmF family)